jgi:hypothetical protein
LKEEQVAGSFHKKITTTSASPTFPVGRQQQRQKTPFKEKTMAKIRSQLAERIVSKMRHATDTAMRLVRQQTAIVAPAPATSNIEPRRRDWTIVRMPGRGLSHSRYH